MIDPTRLAAIKALQPTPGPWREGIKGSSRIYGPDGRGEGISGLIATFARWQDRPFMVAAADPDYGLQALAAEVERLQEREKPVRVKRSQGFKVYACSCGGYPDRAHKFCPHCGRKIEWK